MRGFVFKTMLLVILGSSWSAMAQDRNPWDGSYSLGVQEQAGAEQAVVAEHSNEGMVVAAYGLAWVIVLAYVIRLALRQRRLCRELEELRRLVESQGLGP